MTKKIVILGAGKSSSYLVKYLYLKRIELDISISIVSNKYSNYLDEFESIDYQNIDINNSSKLISVIEKTYILISMLPPFMHFKIAKICSDNGVNMITASYLNDEIKSLEKSFKKNNSFLFMEMGLDPGIDHMSAMKTIDNIKDKGDILEFESYTGGLVKYDKKLNPWGYKFTWNPMNVILAGNEGAIYLRDNEKITIPYNNIFKDISIIKLSDGETYEGYPNRDSIKYKELYNLNQIKSLKRGTLRNKSFCKTWSLLIDIGLTDNLNKINNSNNMSYFDFFNYNIKAKNFDELKQILNKEYDISPKSQEFKNLEWSGFFSNKLIEIKNGTFSDFLLSILKDKWTLEKTDVDVIVMVHLFIYKSKNKLKKLMSYLKIEGEDNIYTAMSKTVGLPIVALIEYLISTNFNQSGIHLPFDKKIYEPVLKKLNELNINFTEKEINI